MSSLKLFRSTGYSSLDASGAARMAVHPAWIIDLGPGAARERLAGRPTVSAWLLPPWTSLLHWQVPALLVGLAVLPTAWVWQGRVRRLSGPNQLNINVFGTLVSCAVLAMSSFVLSRGFY